MSELGRAVCTVMEGMPVALVGLPGVAVLMSASGVGGAVPGCVLGVDSVVEGVAAEAGVDGDWVGRRWGGAARLRVRQVAS